MRPETRRRLSCTGPGGPAPASAQAQSMLRRADAFCAEAGLAEHPEERFRASYLAALRAAGAVIMLSVPRSRRRRPASAWAMLAAEGEPWEGWVARIAPYSTRRAIVDAGSARPVTASEADALFVLAGEFVDAVHRHVDVARSA